VDPNDASFWLYPGDAAKIRLRVYAKQSLFDPTKNAAVAIASEANNNINGVIADSPAVASTIPIITTTAVPDAVSGQLYTTTFKAVGGKPTYSWSAQPDAITNAGVFSHTFATSDGPQSISVTVTDAANATMTKTFPIKVYEPLVITNASLPPATVGQPYNVSLTKTGGHGSYTWSISPATPLPTGLALNSSTGAITGTPTAVSTSSLIFNLTDSAQPPQTAAATLYYTAVVAPAGCGSTVITLFNNWNVNTANNGGTSPGFSTNGQAYCLDSIADYHWYGGHGATPGTIGLTTN